MSCSCQNKLQEFRGHTTNLVRPFEKLCNNKQMNERSSPLGPSRSRIDPDLRDADRKKRSSVHSKGFQLGLSALASFFLVSVHFASGLQPPAPPPIPTPTPPGQIIITPLPTPSVNPDESIPVLINYGQGQET